MGQTHDHDHNHHGHDHPHGHGGGHHHAPTVSDRNEKSMLLAATITGIFMLVEVIGGVISGSLALLADAGHMLTDFAALVLAWLAFRIGRRPANWRHTFGFDRFAVLAAFVNGLSLFLIAGYIIFEAFKRLREPVEVMGLPMLAIALIGLLVNIAVFAILSSADQENLNVKAAALHVLGDLLGSVAAIIAALVIWQTGFVAIDPIVSVIVSLIILRSAWYVVKQSAHILLEGAPDGLDRRKIGDDLLAAFPNIQSIDHIHIWSISQGRPMMTLELGLAKDSDILALTQKVKSFLEDEFGIAHATIEAHNVRAKKPSCNP